MSKSPEPSAWTTLQLQVEQGVATVVLNRPDAANAMDLTMARELAALTTILERDPDLRAVLLTSRGKMFCAGGDLPSFQAAGDHIDRLIAEMTTHLHAAISNLMRMGKPVVVAVNGAAAGAGFSLALAGDLVIAAASAHFTMAYTAIGVSPDGGASYSLPRLVGLRRSAELMLTNRRLSSAEALDWGLVTEVVPDEELEQRAVELARRLAQGPTRAYGTVKQLLASSLDQGLETQMALEARGITELAASPDGREGIEAFLARRRPEFRG